MTEPSQTSYERVPFRGRPIPWASPAALSLASTAHGGPSLEPGRPCRVLELGCGDGANLLPLAYFRPELTCVGVDRSPRALALAHRRVDAIGLKNVSLVEADVADFDPGELPFDVVIAHGLYSWVDGERRAAIRRLAGRALRDDGLLYLSFNAQPGWSVRGRVRDTLRRAGCAQPEGARRRLELLRALFPDETDDAWTALIRGEIERAARGEDGYLTHEYLTETNVPFWLGDVARDLRAEGLLYAGDATFDRPEGFVAPELRARASALRDRIERAEALDLRLYRQLHCAVFVKTDALGDPPPAAALISSAWIAGAARRRNDPFDIRDGMEELFDGPRGQEIRVSDATLKMALLVLAADYPRAQRLDALHAVCAERLQAHGIPVGDRDELADALARLHARMQIELRHEDAALRVEPPSRPRAHPLTRLEAAEGDVLSTPNHAMVPLEPVVRGVIARLDGESTADEITDALTAEIIEGRLELEGAPAGAARVRAQLATQVQSTITQLGWWGLIEPDGKASQARKRSGR